MKYKATLVAMFLWLLAIPVGFAGQNGDYKIISFDAPGAGTLPANQNGGNNQGTGCFGCTFAINQWGTIAGSYIDANNVAWGFTRRPDGRFTTFQGPDAVTTAFNGTLAQGINDFGEITGEYIGQDLNLHGFVRSPEGAYTTFDALEGAPQTTPLFINDEGAVVGYVFDGASNLFRAFLRNPGGDLAVFVGPGSCPLGLNETPNPCFGNSATYVTLFGASVGHFEDSNLVEHGMIRSPDGKLVTFDVPGAGTGVYQGTGCPGCNLGVNFFGAIAGSYTDANNVFHGFLRIPDGKFITFEAKGAGTGPDQGTGCFSDCPMSLNDSGEITGSYWDSNNVQHGFVRSPEGSFVTIDPKGSAGTQPESINDSGTIAGYYYDANGVYHGFLALPRE